MIKLTIENTNQGVITGDITVLQKLYKDFTIRHPQAFYLMRKTGWDGMIHYITERGKFSIGLAPMIASKAREYDPEVILEDHRKPLDADIIPQVPSQVGKLKPRPEQSQVISNIIHNTLLGKPFYIGVQNLSVGFGKTLIMAGTYLAFNRGLKTLVLVNDQDLFKQMQREFPQDLLPGERISFIQGSKITNWSQFNVAMVQSLSRNMKLYQRELSTIQMVLVDEADVADNKTYTNVITHLNNTIVRLGLSGTIYMSKLAKDKVHNMNLRKFFGDEMNQVALHEMIDKGYSTPVVVKFLPIRGHSHKYDYKKEYDTSIIDNPNLYKLSLERVIWNIKNHGTPILIVCKYIRHCESLYAYFKSNLPKLRIAHMHNETPNRDGLIKSLNSGKLDILITTTIICRGKNIPNLKYLLNLTSFASNEKSIQLLGRLVRTFSGKTKAYLDDLMFTSETHYLYNHSRKRLRYYKNEKIKTIILKINEKKGSKKKKGRNC